MGHDNGIRPKAGRQEFDRAGSVLEERIPEDRKTALLAALKILYGDASLNQRIHRGGVIKTDIVKVYLNSVLNDNPVLNLSDLYRRLGTEAGLRLPHGCDSSLRHALYELDKKLSNYFMERGLQPFRLRTNGRLVPAMPLERPALEASPATSPGNDTADEIYRRINSDPLLAAKHRLMGYFLTAPIDSEVCQVKFHQLTIIAAIIAERAQSSRRQASQYLKSI